MAENIETQPSDQGDNRNPDGTFKPGFSGNPTGRPKGRTIMSVLLSRMEEIPNGQTKPWVEQIAEILLEAIVIKKDMSALRTLTEYTETKPKQGIELDVNKDNIDSLTGLLKEMSSINTSHGPNIPALTPPSSEPGVSAGGSQS